MDRSERESTRMSGRRILRLLIGTFGGTFLLFLCASFYVELRYWNRIHSVADAPAAPVALVFGAGLAPKEALSPVLAERMDAAIALYRAGKVGALLLSGDNSDRYHDETEAMVRYARARDIPQNALKMDDAGLSTYQSCFRARAVFGVEQVLLVTQDFHLPRALFIANSMGMNAHGVAADPNPSWRAAYEVRELFSRALALAMVLTQPMPTPSR